MTKIDTHLAGILDTAGDSASYDAACKRLWTNKVILAWIMKSCMEEYRNCSIEEIAGCYSEGTPQIAQVALHQDEPDMIQGMNTEDISLNEGRVYYDIRFLAIAPVSGELVRLIINVESQNDFFPGYPLIKRGIYYCSRMISAQHGTEFTNSNYGAIKKVYSIWICMNPTEKWKNTITEYSFSEKNLLGTAKESVENYDLMTVIMICLGRPEQDNYEGIIRLLEVLLSSGRGVEEKKKILGEEFQIKMTAELESEVALMCNLSQGVEAIGFEKGLAAGIECGIERTMLEAIKNLMDSLNLTKEQAMSALKVPEEEREKYMELLKG